MSSPVDLTPDLIGRTVIVQAFERKKNGDLNQKTMTKSVGVLAGYGVDFTGTNIVFRHVDPVQYPASLHLEFYVPTCESAANE